ncbi:MAG: hypothetical protein IJ039_01540 [Clostridia bacterium]|nr:hypothetical protein [Clostridia bacterium]
MLKKVISIVLSVAFVVSLLALTSCSIDFRSDVEKAMDKFLKADSYTVTVNNDLGMHTYMVNNGTVYFFEDYDETEKTSYLYSDENDYYYATVSDGEETQSIEKAQLKKEAYVIKYMDTIQESDIVNQVFAYRHILDMAEKTDKGYKYSVQESTDEYTYRIIYTIEMDDGSLVLTQKYESKKEKYEEQIVISNVGKTRIEIPDKVLSK